MNYRALLHRVMDQVDDTAYLTPTSQVDPRMQLAMREIEGALRAHDADPEQIRALARRLHEEGRIDRILYLSALHVIAASPRVKDYVEAARIVGEQEIEALQRGGPNLSSHLASVERHRGVLAFLLKRHEAALDHFLRALERERSAENVGNVLCALLALGEEDEARSLFDRITHSFPAPLVAELQGIVARDPDLALLRDEESP